MKITCEKKYLSSALSSTGRAVSARNTLPVLANILLETQDDRVKLTATDLDTAIRSTIPAQVGENGAVAVPAHLLADVVSKLPDAPITLEHTDGKMKVRCGKSDYTVLCLPAEDYPAVPEVNDGIEFTVDQRVLKDVLHHTTFAASNEETRSLLMGVLFEANKGSLRGVATDTHRLAWKQVDGLDIDTKGSCVIPSKPLTELSRMLTGDAPVTVRFGSSQAQFETPDVTLVSRLLDGQFPNYDKVIPKAPERKAVADRAQLLAAVQRVYIVAKGAAEKAIFKFEKDLLTISAESPEVGKAYEEVPITLDGEELTIAYNARYLVNVLNILSSETVSIEMTGNLNPGIVRKGDSNDFLYVVMPMQV